MRKAKAHSQTRRVQSIPSVKYHISTIIKLSCISASFWVKIVCVAAVDNGAQNFSQRKNVNSIMGLRFFHFEPEEAILSSDSELTLANTLTYGKVSIKVILLSVTDLRSRCPS